MKELHDTCPNLTISLIFLSKPKIFAAASAFTTTGFTFDWYCGLNPFNNDEILTLYMGHLAR